MIRVLFTVSNDSCGHILLSEIDIKDEIDMKLQGYICVKQWNRELEVQGFNISIDIKVEIFLKGSLDSILSASLQLKSKLWVGKYA